MTKNTESLSLRNSAKLTQLGRHQSRIQEVPGSILSGGIFCAEVLLLSAMHACLYFQHYQLCVITEKRGGNYKLKLTVCSPLHN